MAVVVAVAVAVVADEAGATRPAMSHAEGFLASLRRIARGDVGPIVDRMERHIGRAEQYLEHEGRSSRDAAVIVGLSLTMLGIKALKLLPNIPFAPGTSSCCSRRSMSWRR